MPETTDTYTQPPHGWTCFHCGETFTTPGSAQEHFGTPESISGCQMGSERGLLREIRKLESLLREAQLEVEGSENDLRLAAEFKNEVKRLTGSESLDDLRMWVDSLNGRIATANALIEGFREKSPGLFAEVIG